MFIVDDDDDVDNDMSVDDDDLSVDMRVDDDC